MSNEFSVSEIEKSKIFNLAYNEGKEHGSAIAAAEAYTKGYDDGHEDAWESCMDNESQENFDSLKDEIQDLKEQLKSARESVEYFVNALYQEDNSLDAFTRKANRTYGPVITHTSNASHEILLDLPKPKQEEPIYYFVRVYEHEKKKYPYFIGGYDGMLWAFKYWPAPDETYTYPLVGYELCMIDIDEYNTNGCMTKELREILLGKDES